VLATHGGVFATVGGAVEAVVAITGLVTAKPVGQAGDLLAQVGRFGVQGVNAVLCDEAGDLRDVRQLLSFVTRDIHFNVRGRHAVVLGTFVDGNLEIGCDAIILLTRVSRILNLRDVIWNVGEQIPATVFAALASTTDGQGQNQTDSHTQTGFRRHPNALLWKVFPGTDHDPDRYLVEYTTAVSTCSLEP